MTDASPATAARVVIVNDASLARGGATALALLSARLIAARGIAVTYVTGDAGDSPAARALRAGGVEVVALGGARLLEQSALKSATAGVWNGATRAMISRVLAQDTPDTVYHVHGWAQILSPALFAALAPVARRTVIHAHDLFLACPNGVYHDYRADRPCTRTPLGAACLTTNCDKQSYPRKLWRVARQAALRRALDPRAPWGRIAMIHPKMAPVLERVGHPAARLVTLRNPAEAWADTRIPAEANREILFVGRVAREKSVDDLCAAARQAGVSLTVVGDGPLRESLSAAYPEVTFAGWQDRAGIAAHAARARGLIMPTRAPEPFGLVAAEASLSGLPVLVADRALIAEEVSSGGLGLAFGSGGTPALAAAMTQLIGMPDEKVHQISDRGFSRTAPLAQTPEAWTDALIDLYGNLL
ncbi:glycosyltransferase family 4 protein [Acidimangrovimonas sediminis]|uniref:glycosyltransferase family 4 protein n=1 Tax=Acidimangrovimonas sediminis TaxID=2056283 RepID=UPI000C7FBCEC|nr:glycosyltransferase family 4 protein [Acidimangrovimonas sediminis]